MLLQQKTVRSIKKRRNSFLNKSINRLYSFLKKLKKEISVPSRKLIVGILVTEKCNLKCVYCYEKYKTDKTITLSKMQEIVSHVMNTNSIWTDIEFRLLGGEPFIESKLIREIVEWTSIQKWDKQWSFKITTNGTLLNEKMKKWLSQYKNRICVILSLDGPLHVHNKNRHNSYSNIDFTFFTRTWPKQPVKMTVNKDTLGELSNSVLYIEKHLGFNVSFSLAGGVKWNENDLKTFEEEQRKLLILYTKKKLKFPPLYNINLGRVLYPHNATRQCGIGHNVIAYDTDGNSFPCHLFLPNVIKKQNIPKFSEFANDQFLIDDYCKGCVIENICPTCYAFNFIERGKSNMRDHNFCMFYKSIVKYSVLFKIFYYSRKLYFNEDEQKEIDAILFLLKKLSMTA